MSRTLARKTVIHNTLMVINSLIYECEAVEKHKGTLDPTALLVKLRRMREKIVQGPAGDYNTREES